MMEFEKRPDEINFIDGNSEENEINIIEEKKVEKPDFYNVAQQQIEEYKWKHDDKM